MRHCQAVQVPIGKIHERRREPCQIRVDWRTMQVREFGSYVKCGLPIITN